MNRFETPNDLAAHLAGMSVEVYEARADAIVADLDYLDSIGQPDMPRESRRLVSESDMEPWDR